MKELFYEMLKEAQDGKIVVDGEEWPIGFNTMIHADGELQENFYSAQNLSTLKICSFKNSISIWKKFLKKKRVAIAN